MLIGSGFADTLERTDDPEHVMAFLFERWWRTVVLMLVLACGAAPVAAREAPAVQDEIAVAQLPREAQHTLALIKQDGPFPYPKDGTVFGNRERRLPSQTRGYYREYTVPTPGARNRGARRIIAGQKPGGNTASRGEYWYTADHYSTFSRIRE
jgi:ribonuclease T1